MSAHDLVSDNDDLKDINLTYNKDANMLRQKLPIQNLIFDKNTRFDKLEFDITDSEPSDIIIKIVSDEGENKAYNAITSSVYDEGEKRTYNTNTPTKKTKTKKTIRKTPKNQRQDRNNFNNTSPIPPSTQPTTISVRKKFLVRVLSNQVRRPSRKSQQLTPSSINSSQAQEIEIFQGDQTTPTKMFPHPISPNATKTHRVNRKIIRSFSSQPILEKSTMPLCRFKLSKPICFEKPSMLVDSQTQTDNENEMKTSNNLSPKQQIKKSLSTKRSKR